MERQLASIQKVESVEPIAGADNIELIRVLGWFLIAKKGEFVPGDRCVFFEIDSVLPETEWSEFLRPKKFRVKTMKLGKFGVVSQGLALPMSILPTEWFFSAQRDNDVTELLGVTKHEEPEVFTNLRGHNLKPFPAGIPKTDETRIQSAPWILDLMAGKPWYATVKLDGSSMTVGLRNDQLIVASRRFIVEDDGNAWYEMAKKLDLAKRLVDHPNIFIQGELVGPGIQSNRMGLKEHRFFVFNAFNANTGQYFDMWALFALCTELDLDMVEVVADGESFDFTIDELVEQASGFYPLSGHPREGLVFRPLHAIPHPLLGQVSFKSINVDYLLKVGA